jgi:hypothetical protein
MNAIQTLPQILTEADAIARFAQSRFGQLNAAQLNWKPGAGQWSVAQCLQHLIATNLEMVSIFDAAIKGTKRTSFLERLPVLPGLWGKMMVKFLAPENKQKYKAIPKVTPAGSGLDPQIVGQFVAHQQEVIGKMNSIQNLQLEKIRMTSPFASFITYSLLDACRIIVVHERRHFAQAERVMATSGFPT